ncbi:serine hydrolase [Caldalkalibacillus mannanilyticus]|uniref:serine hydrolase n=1 Tax=Caldalkalibacillus mannanilyticus TaxID=1418 RepID=UPI0004681955|nr:serine hydrolase [Caldalkalibacillus mannanilyticus]
MGKIIILILGLVIVIILIIIIGVMISGIISIKQARSKTPEDILKFMKKSPEKSSLYLVKNGETMIDYQSDQMMPLASTVKIILAIEYAVQVARGNLDPTEKIALAELEKYYIKNTDGQAHPKWLKQMEAEGRILDQQVTLEDVAKGMISHSSNANTEYLFQILGIEQINLTLRRLGIVNHSYIFPMTSANILPTMLKEEQSLSYREVKKKLEAMPHEEFIERAMNIHRLLSEDHDHSVKEKYYDKKSFSEKLQLIRSNRLPASTTKEYAKLMGNIIHSNMLTEKERKIMRTILEFSPNPNYEYLGWKGGSTIFVLTVALYARTKDGNNIELAWFINDPSRLDYLWLQYTWQPFLKKLITDPAFLVQAVEIFAGSSTKEAH